MAHHPAVIGHIARRAHKNSTGMHQLAERKIDQQDANQKDVDKKDHANFITNCRGEGGQPDAQLLDRHDINPKDVPHQNTAEPDGKEQQQGKIIGG